MDIVVLLKPFTWLLWWTVLPQVFMMKQTRPNSDSQHAHRAPFYDIVIKVTLREVKIFVLNK